MIFLSDGSFVAEKMKGKRRKKLFFLSLCLRLCFVAEKKKSHFFSLSMALFGC